MSASIIGATRPRTQFTGLPSELIEAIIVFTAAAGGLTAPASVGQTCRAMRCLVYQANDQHLWRELYLAVFDDPRVVYQADRTIPSIVQQQPEGGVGAQEGSMPGSSTRTEQEYDWASLYRKQVWAGLYVSNSAKTSYPSGKSRVTLHSLSDARPAIIQAYETIMTVVTTARPSPQTTATATGSKPPPPASAPTSLFSNNYPLFPPPPLSAPGPFTSVNPNALHSSEPPPRLYNPLQDPDRISLNIKWLQNVLYRGPSHILLRRMSGITLYGGLQAVWADPEEAREFRAFCRLICCTGYTPISRSIPDSPRASTESWAKAEGEADLDASNGFCRAEGLEAHTSHSTSPQSSPSSANLGESLMYVSVAGPSGIPGVDEFLEEFTPPSIPDIQLPEEGTRRLDMSEAAQRARARRLARMRVYNLRYLSADRHWGPYLLPRDQDKPRDDMSSGAFLQPILALFADHDAGHPNHHHHHNHEDEDNDDDSDAEEPDPLEMHPEETNPLPSANSLYPDWAFLAAARIVIEENLRGASDVHQIGGLTSLDSLRRASAIQAARYGEVDVERPLQPDAGYADGNPGWDWAGVTGAWRRCVCWLGYRDLILQNVEKPDSAFTRRQIDEAVRIVPMRLRVHSYSPCTVPGYEHRPNIHIVGESAGPGTAGQGTQRRMQGTVGVIADGSIRWSLYSMFEQEQAAEWITEGVQLGEAQSAMGVIGMWTGAHHERMDPIGPVWMWKVG